MSGHEWAPEPGELRGDESPLSPAVGPVPVFASPDPVPEPFAPPVEEDGPEPDPVDEADAPEVRPRRMGFRFSLPRFRARRDGEAEAEEGEVEILDAPESLDPEEGPDAEDDDPAAPGRRRGFRFPLPAFRRARVVDEIVEDAETAVETEPDEPGPDHEAPARSRRLPALALKREARVGLAAALSFAILVTVWISNKGRAPTLAIPPKGEDKAAAAAENAKEDKPAKVADAKDSAPAKPDPATPPAAPAPKGEVASPSDAPASAPIGIGALASNVAAGEPAFPAAAPAPAPIDPAAPAPIDAATPAEVPAAAPATAPIPDALPPAGSPDPASALSSPALPEQAPAMPGAPILPGDPAPPESGDAAALPSMPMPDPTPVPTPVDEPKAAEPPPASTPMPDPMPAPAEAMPELPAAASTPEPTQIPQIPPQADAPPVMTESSAPPAMTEAPALPSFTEPAAPPVATEPAAVPAMPETPAPPAMPAPPAATEEPAPPTIPEKIPAPEEKRRPPAEPRPATPVPPESTPPLDPVPASSPISEPGPETSSSPSPGGMAEPDDLEEGFIRIKTRSKRMLVSTPSADGFGVAAAAGSVGGVAAASIADGPAPREDVVARDQVEPKLHRVRSGENFWTISRLYYGTGRYYRALHAANRGEVPTITELWVGTVLRIPPPETLDRSLVDPPTRERLVDRSAGATVSRTSNTTEQEERAELSVPTAPRPRRRAAIEAPEEPPARPTYKVRSSYETLRGIARDTLGDARRYREILNLNRSVIDEDAALTPGQTLTLPADADVGRRGR